MHDTDFGSINICEQWFSIMKNKGKTNTKIFNEHSENSLKIAITSIKH